MFPETHRRELWATSRVGRYTIESDLMKATLQELEKRVKQVQDHSERLASEKRQLEVGDIPGVHPTKNLKIRIILTVSYFH